jgi:hypothetical protein
MGDSPSRKDVSSSESAVRRAAEALAALAPHGLVLGAGVAELLEDATRDVEVLLARTDLTLAVVADAAGRRALLRAVLGDAVVRTPVARRERVTRVRIGESFDYVAHARDGEVVPFALTVPDKDPIYQRSIEKAERDALEAIGARRVLENDVEAHRNSVRAIESSICALHEELEAADNSARDAWATQQAAEAKLVAVERAAPHIPQVFLKAPPRWAFWLWLLRWIVRGKWREPLARYALNSAQVSIARARVRDLASETSRTETARDDVEARRVLATSRLVEEQADLARAELVLGEEARVAAARARIEQLLRERLSHVGERREEFFTDLRELDETPRGDAITELDIELPDHHPGALPRGVGLVFAAAPLEEAIAAFVAEHDGLVLVRGTAAGARPALVDTLRLRLPLAATFTIGTGPPGLMPHEVRETLARVRDCKFILPAKLVLRLRACISDVDRARVAAETEHQRRLDALESQRIPDPNEFRTRRIARSEPAIEKGADGVIETSVEHVRAVFEALKKDWSQRVSEATGTRKLEDCIRDINEHGKIRVLELLEETCELIAREMQSLGETLERWALDEVKTSYLTARRMRAQSLAAVASEITADDLVSPIATLVPIGGAPEAFRRQRVLIGLVGAALGALAGSWIRPGLGTAVGALVGVFCAYLKPSASLRKTSLRLVEAYVDGTYKRVSLELRQRRPAVVQGIRASLDAALAGTLERLNESITRLMTVERDAIAREQAVLLELVSTRGTLEEHDTRLRECLASLGQASFS